MSTTRRLPLLLLLLLAACDDSAPTPAEDLLLKIQVPVEPVTTGRAFPLTVLARWTKSLPVVPPDMLRSGSLRPLLVKLESTERREDATHIEEVSRFQAYAFTREDVTIGPISWGLGRDAAQGNLQTTTPRLNVRVRPDLVAGEASPPEVPTELLAEPQAWTPWAVATVGLFLALALLLWRRRRSRSNPAPALPAPAPPGPEAVLARLRATDAATPALQILGLAGILRGEVAARWSLPAHQRTSSETLRSLSQRQVATSVLAPLARVLLAADSVKFGAHVPLPAEGAAALAAAEACARASAASPQGTA